MALARLSSIPLELQYLASKELDPFDLLTLSHVSQYWRAFVMDDKRWSEWFGLIVSADESLEECLARLNVSDVLPKRNLVYRCLCDSCTVCGEYAAQLYIPHMKRVCDKCLRGDEFIVLPLSSALAKYDLRERDASGVLTLEYVNPNRNSKRPAKLVSESMVKKAAIHRYGSADLLSAHLAWKTKSARNTYSTRSEDYRAAVRTREALEEAGDTAAASAVVLARTGRAIPKAFPAYPGILMQPARPVERGVVCFRLRRLAVVGNEVVRFDDDSDGEEDSE
ncbi:hypothetical protein C8R43DRAFT_1127798 [Mycena crocata]|nr:hypothetical protein C8R43DRAFT_1127798 [Mycena crocata]